MEEVVEQMERELSFSNEMAITIVNEENGILQNELLEKRKALKKSHEEAEEQEKKLKLMKEHLDAVLQTVQHNQQLQRALEGELSSEEHLKKLRDTEVNWMVRETQAKNKLVIEIQRKQEVAEKLLSDYHKKLDSLLSAVNWEHETTREWMDDAMTHEEDNLSLLKTNRDSERKMKELGKHLEKLQVECRQWKAASENAYNNHLNLQQEIMRMANDFTSVHLERERVVNLWQKALREMESRDTELIFLGKEVDSVREKKEALTAIKKEKEDLLSSEEANNKELEFELTKLESTFKGLQKQLDAFSDESKMESEVMNLKCMAQGLSLELNSGQGLLKQLEKQFQERNQKLKGLKVKGQELQETHSSLKDDSFSVERQVELLEANLDQVEKEQGKLMTEEHQLLLLYAKKKDSLQQLKEEITFLTQAVRSTSNLDGKLDKEITKVTKTTNEAETLLTNLNLQKSNLEARVKKMLGQTKEKEEEDELHLEVLQVQQLLSKKEESLGILLQQLQDSQNHIQRTRKDLERVQKEKTHLKQKVETIELTTENTLRMLRKTTSSKQEMSIDKSLLEVNLRKLQQLVHENTHSIESIQKQQMEMELTVKEQLQKANYCKEMLQLEINMASQERQFLNNAWNSAKCLLEKLHSRYEVLLNALPEKELVDQDPVLLIDRAEQERDELLKERKNLEETLSKTKQESEALKNNLKLVEESNSGIRDNTKAVNGTVQEHSKIEELEDSVHELYKKIYEKEKGCRESQGQIEDKQSNWEQMQNICSDKEQILRDKQREVENLQAAIKMQMERIGRADVQTSRALAASRKVLEEGFPKEEVHMDIRLRLLLDLQKRMNCLISEVVCQNPEVLPVARSLFEQAHIPIPSLPEVKIRKKSDSGSTSSLSSQSSGASSQVSLINLEPHFAKQSKTDTETTKK